MTPSDTERLILEVQKRPSLWDTSSEEYDDRYLKKRCWEDIVDVFKENEELTKQERVEFEDMLQRKWKSIRACFTRELNRQRKLKAGLDVGSRKSEYKYFKLLQFLKDFVVIRESQQLMEPAEHSEDEVIHVQKRMKREDRSPEECEDEPFINIFTNSIEQNEKHESPEYDEDKFFLLSLLSTLKKVPEHKKMTTKIKIMSLLDEATNSSHDYT